METNATGLNYADVFLSYSHDDREAVEKAANIIKNAGFRCWIDKDRLRRAEEPYNQIIDEAIDQSIIFIAFLSKTYVNKPYCIHEFDRAVDKQKSIISVCIDDVSENTNRQCAYMFSFSAGHTIPGFQTGIDATNNGNIEEFAGQIISSVPMTQLKTYTITGDKKDYPPISTPDYIIACLRSYHEKQYEQSGNYALNEIRSELFPAIKDTEINILYKDENKKDVSLLTFLSKDEEQTNHDKHILVTGEGGMGKTVTLLETCRKMLSRRINAIYVPLSKIGPDLTLDQYLERIVCRGNQRIWGDLKNLMGTPYSKIPNVVLLLDGINEITLDYMDTFLQRELKTMYIDGFCGVKLIITSRWLDNSSMRRIQDYFIHLEMQPLDEETVKSYLDDIGILSTTNEKIISLLQTPLLLTLYADVEKHKSKYQNIKGIHLEDNPDTAGKILSNFFQTQLYRASEEETFDQTLHLVLLDYLLPSLAYKMFEKQSMFLREDELWNCIDEIDNSDQRYLWYKNDTLRRTIRGRIQFEPDLLKELAVDSLHFLHETDAGYEFLHQSFRDYFAAFHIANEMKALQKDPHRISDIDPLLEQEIYPDDIISYISDITHEEDARPQMTDDGWIFPGKESTAASEKSIAEQLLPLWRNKEGRTAQNAVANLFNTMKTGRQKALGWCDFSCLDLRKCWFNESRFTLWYENDTYPSRFDGAWIDRENFLTNGHETIINAVAFDGYDRIFSGDESGMVKIYSLSTHAWIDSIQLQSRKIIDLAWNAYDEVLAVLYENILFCYSLKNKTVVSSYGNSSQSKSFRYVEFSEDNEIRLSFDLEPLTWYDVHGNKLSSDLPFDVPAGCAKWNPKKKEFVRSTLLQILSTGSYDETTSSWGLPAGLKRKFDEENQHLKERGQKEKTECYVSLRDLGNVKTGKVTCIQYNKEGTKVLVAIQNYLAELDADSFDILNKKKFTGNIQCACYLTDGIAVGRGNDLILLDSDFSESYVLKGSQIKQIAFILEDYNNEGYYLFSASGEIKKLNHELIVQNMRFARNQDKKAEWARDRLTNDVQMVFLPNRLYPYGARYSYEKAQFEPLGWRYELLDLRITDSDEEQRYYKLGTSLMIVERIPPYRKITYTNYSGIWIFGCTFNHIQGDLSNRRNTYFLMQNGGIIDDG